MERHLLYHYEKLQGILMKIYLSVRPQPVEMAASYKWVSSLDALSALVSASEASSIICNGFLSMVDFGQVEAALKTIISKMRINSELIIINPDISILSQRLTREEINLTAINEILFKNGPIKSVLPTSLIEELLPKNINIFNKHFDLYTSEIIIKARRSS